MTFTGADPDALEALAHQLDDGAKTLDTIESTMSSQLRSVAWRGRSGDEFRQQWARQYASGLRHTQTAISAAAGTLRRNAAAQRDASKAEGGASVQAGASDQFKRDTEAAGFGLTGPQDHALYTALAAGKPPPADLVQKYPELNWAAGDGHALLDSEANQGPAAQAAWWDSLSKEKQEALILAFPTTVAGMQGLPPEVRQRALAQARVEYDDIIAATTMKEDVDVEGTIRFISFGAGASMTETIMNNGRTTVEIKGIAHVGASADDGGSSAGVEVDASASQTFSFDDPDQAQHFIDGLISSATPKGLGDLSPAAFTSHVNTYMQSQSAHHVDTTVEGGITDKVTVKGAGGEVNLSEGASVSHSLTDHTSTVTSSFDSSAKTTGFAVGEVQASGSISVTLDNHGQIQSAHISGIAGGGAGAGLALGPVDDPVFAASLTNGSEIHFDSDIDLTDPANAAAIANFAAHPGDPQAMQALFDHSRTVIQTVDYSRFQDSTNLVVAKVTEHESLEVTTHAVVREPGGSWVTVQ